LLCDPRLFPDNTETFGPQAGRTSRVDAVEAVFSSRASEQNMWLTHPWRVQAEGNLMETVERSEAPASFETFFEDERQRLFKALYFVTGDRDDAEELTQDAFLRLWERWDEIDRIDDPTAYLFRVALNGFRMRRRRAAMAVRKLTPSAEPSDAFVEADMRADVRALLLRLTPRQRAALLLVDLLGHSPEQAGRILRVRPSTVRSLATQGRQTLRAEGAQDA
jgi:RNA polymerase sigma-70 factor (ECF subfamily)